jgi:hypothetical protein
VTREKVTVSMPPDLAARARQMSDKTGVPLSAVIQRLLERWIASGGALLNSPLVEEQDPQIKKLLVESSELTARWVNDDSPEATAKLRAVLAELYGLVAAGVRDLAAAAPSPKKGGSTRKPKK